MDLRYTWNSNILKDFQYQKIKCIWTIPIIQGYISQKNLTFQGKPFQITLVSRRREARGGARFYCRGIDDDGNCGNFVESEVIVKTPTNIHSFVSVRGSIPIFWKQK
jgi:hypothetical protein